jgi:hypothetical protein
MIRIGSSFALLFALAPSPARAQAAWPPPMPDLRALAAASAVPPPAAAAALYPGMLDKILPLLAEKNYHGLSDEAWRASDWQRGRRDVGLRETRGAYELTDAQGASFPLTSALGTDLAHANQYFGMTPASLAHPPTHAELAAAATSPEGVESVARIFERTIAARVNAPSATVVPEAGGEATLEGAMILHEIPDMTRDVLPLVARAYDDADELARLYARYPEPMKAIDDSGLLANFLRMRPGWQARGMEKEKIDKVLRVTVDTILRNTSDAYIFEPDTQFAAITSQDWSGRYVGRWHTHPPHAGPEGWGASDVPSGPDMDIASKEGQNMVFSFQPDGFDFYDLSPLDGIAPDLDKVLKTSYRSPAWRARFQALYERAFPQKP